jgi:hypothetical protein
MYLNRNKSSPEYGDRKGEKMKTYLNVSYAQKDIAKSHGARWDSNSKRWYFEGEEIPEGLKKFIITKDTVYRCRCGNTGRAGAYPFSTIQGGSVCDDCI